MKAILPILFLSFFAASVTAQTPFRDLTVVQYGDSILINWTLTGGATCFDMHLLRAAPGSDFEQIYTISGVCGGATDQFYEFVDFDGLESGNTYEYKVTASNGTFSTNTVEIQYVNAGNQALLVYPNPTFSNFWVTIDNNYTPSFLVELYSMYGQLLFQTVRLQRLFEVETNNLTAGVYLLKITTENGELFSKQVIVQ